MKKNAFGQWEAEKLAGTLLLWHRFYRELARKQTIVNKQLPDSNLTSPLHFVNLIVIKGKGFFKPFSTQTAQKAVKKLSLNWICQVEKLDVGWRGQACKLFSSLKQVSELTLAELALSWKYQPGLQYQESNLNEALTIQL